MVTLHDSNGFGVRVPEFKVRTRDAPVYHHLEDRCNGHLFITVLAYQAVQLIRRKLKEHGINESWESLREKLGSQCRITATFKQRDGKTLHVRQATQPEQHLKNIYTKLGISSSHRRKTTLRKNFKISQIIYCPVDFFLYDTRKYEINTLLANSFTQS